MLSEINYLLFVSGCDLSNLKPLKGKQHVYLNVLSNLFACPLKMNCFKFYVYSSQDTLAWVSALTTLQQLNRFMMVAMVVVVAAELAAMLGDTGMLFAWME